MKYRVLVTDTIAESGLNLLRDTESIDLDYRPDINGAALLAAVSEADAIITRSGTSVTRELLEAGTKLRVVARAGVGFDNVDIDEATKRGVLVLNAPTANILSATEHTMAMLLALCRNIPTADASIRQGQWERSRFMGLELYGKTLGIIGLGRIGSRVAARAKPFRVKVVAYDPYISPSVGEKAGVELLSLDQLLEQAHIITVHTPLTDETRGMIGAQEIEKMRDGVLLINCARGGIYDEEAVASGLQSGKVARAAIDVFVDEPPRADHPLRSAPNLIMTPHIGANTLEAQDRVALQTSEMVIEALSGSVFVSAVNLPFEGSVDQTTVSMIDLAERLGTFATQILHGPLSRAGIELWGIEERLLRILSVAGMKGLLNPHLNEAVNFVNAETITQSRGIDWSTTLHPLPKNYTNLITIRAASDEQEVQISGTLFTEKTKRVVNVNGYSVEFRPEKTILYIINRDVPGVVGKVGTILGDREINIAEYNLARKEGGGTAMAIITIDGPIDNETVNFIRSFREVEEVKVITF